MTRKHNGNTPNKRSLWSEKGQVTNRAKTQKVSLARVSILEEEATTEKDLIHGAHSEADVPDRSEVSRPQV
jgi:hypothetical protein